MLAFIIIIINYNKINEQEIWQNNRYKNDKLFLLLSYIFFFPPEIHSMNRCNPNKELGNIDLLWFLTSISPIGEEKCFLIYFKNILTHIKLLAGAP